MFLSSTVYPSCIVPIGSQFESSICIPSAWLPCAAQISRDMPHYHKRHWSQADLEALQHLGKQLRMYCAKIRAALAPIREAVSSWTLHPIGTLHISPQNTQGPQFTTPVTM